MLQNPVLTYREHSAGTAARIEQRTDLSLPAKVIRSPRKNKRNQQPHDITGGIMLPARLVRHFGKAPEQLLEDLPHGMVVDRLRMQVHGGELLDEQEQPVVLM